MITSDIVYVTPYPCSIGLDIISVKVSDLLVIACKKSLNLVRNLCTKSKLSSCDILNIMKIISIDPGYERLGVAIVEKVDGRSKEQLIFSECFRTSAKSDFNERLLQVGQRVKGLIEQYKPEALAIEKLYFNSNQKTAIQVSQVIGSIIFLAKDSGLEVFEYTPLQIKLAVAGNGKGSKDDVTTMLKYLIDLPDKKMLDDEYDAIAVGLTHFAHNRINMI